ncbi:probable flavin-containing monooxygenase 1 [Cajanus cajan]|uniref:Flavin-containing monooxygenase n=1 Tax=Cajanus cajan TaxID=3821 RepID=A0A151QX96_CAJCA|nr:probable flavin-containing monooxygenase 1 [Cajanus cajan]KYP34835.1 putative flavin-containing monooxygenase 1 [Cajanus cajan]
MERRVAIIGAGTSGLVACKYLLEFGFKPIVFEADDGVGGLWRHTMESTKLQNNKKMYHFIDFPWPSSVTEDNPSHKQVIDYLDSYAQHFGLIPYIRFNSKVIDIDYVGKSSEEMESWELWGGNGRPFCSKGTWHVSVQDTKNFSIEVHKAEFVILCIGKHSGFPNIPEFPPGQGPEVFNGRVMHSMDYSNLDSESAVELIKRKRVTVVGSQKSGLDIAAECANANGITYPCTIIQRTAHWFVPDFNIWGVIAGYLCLSRFAELLVHKPGESFLLCLLATLLSPLRWGISKLIETALKWKLPLKKYGLVPNHSFFQDLSSCLIGVFPDNFFDKLEEGSILIKKSQSFRFCKEGIIIDGEAKPLETDVVIFATGFKGDQKIKSLFKSPIFQNYIIGPTTSTVPLFRQIIHPRIPQLAIIGYAEGLTNIFASEMKSLWLGHFLDGSFEVPSIREMEKDVKLWEENLKQYGGRYYWKSCIANCAIWYHDQLCKDMNINPRRKKGFFSEWFVPYGILDYVALTPK